MSAIVVAATLLESIRLATTLIGKLNAGEMTPEEATAEWTKTSSGFTAAVDAWNATQAPGGR